MDTTPDLDQQWDAIVIGGGVAGLSAALMLTRARRRVLVVDAGSPRNRYAAHMHGVLGHDGRPPGDLVADGRREVVSYGGVLLTDTVVTTSAEGGGLHLETAAGRHLGARRVVVATGLRDDLPELTGLREQWGSGVVVCPYCDGWEWRDRRIGVLATGPGSLHQVQLLRQWSPAVTYLADVVGAPEGETLDALRARGIVVVEGPVDRVVTDTADRLTGVRMGDGRVVDLDVVFVVPTMVPLDEPLRQLGADRTETPAGSFVAVDGTGRTSVPGVWAVGNATSPAANVPIALGAGAMAGAMVNADLVEADIEVAVTALANAH